MSRFASRSSPCALKGSQVDITDLVSDKSKDRLAAHTELIYYKTPLRYFILGCVRPSNVGGETIVFDARVAADLIAEQAPELASVRIEYRARVMAATLFMS